MGERLGRYETIRQLATGGMATVYLGRARGEGGFERLVALKVMHPHIASDPDFVAMFLDEARLAARIRHPNVVPTIDVQKSDDGMFLVMEYVEGTSLSALRRYLKKQGKTLPLPIMLRVMLDLLNGLHAAHELTDDSGSPLNLVHRDVSPQNVLVGKDGISRITDFGVARAEARISSTRGGQLKGKLAYMPPEQILSEPVDRRSDVYAAGVVLWELLVGRRLFHAANEGALVHRIVSGDKKPPSESTPVPASIEAVCMKALSLTPDNRYRSADDMADALEEAAAEAGIRIGRPRSVGELVTELMPALEEISQLKRDSMIPHSGSVPLSSAAPQVRSLSPSSMPSFSNSSPTHTEAVLNSSVGRGTTRKQTTYWAAGAVAAGAVLAIVAWQLGGLDPPTDGQGHNAAVGDSASPTPGASADASAPTAGATATPPPTSTASASSDAASLASAEPSATPSASASSAVSAQAATPPPAVVLPRPGVPPVLPKPSPQPAGTNYRPPGL